MTDDNLILFIDDVFILNSAPLKGKPQNTELINLHSRIFLISLITFIMPNSSRVYMHPKQIQHISTVRI